MNQPIQANCEIPATNGMMAGYLAKPRTGDARAAFLLFVELWGMTAHMREVAERLAGEGYAAVVCDLFRGRTPPVPDDPQEKWAETF